MRKSGARRGGGRSADDRGVWRIYLHETLCDDEGVCYPMAGVIPASAINTGKLVRFGYVMLTERRRTSSPAGAQIAGHEFHYYDSTDNGVGAVAKKPVNGRSWECVHESPSQWMGFRIYIITPIRNTRTVSPEKSGGQNLLEKINMQW